MVHPDFRPVTLILISRYRERRPSRASFRFAMCTPHRTLSLKPLALTPFREHLFCDHDGTHCIGPAGIKRQERDYLDQLFLLDPILYSPREVKTRLWTVRSVSQVSRHGDCCKA